MKKKLLLTATVLIAGIIISDAQISTKLDLRLYHRISSGIINEEDIPLLVKGETARIKRLTEQYRGRFKYGYNNISSIEIPEKNLIAFSNELAVEKIENTHSAGKMLMDTARIRNNIDSVQAGYSPLPQNYKGRGVIIGIIDGGIDWQHQDFKDSAGNTRIRYIWDQKVTGTNPPLPYNYGNEWNWTDINTGSCTHVEPFGACSDFSHGTCVAGIAAGNGGSVDTIPYLASKYTGVAPESEIIAVAIGTDGCYTNFQTSVADAVDYIFKKADALGKPCVINTSLGDYYGSHDGIDLTTQMIETLLDQRNGRVLVAAAGNAGGSRHHLTYPIPADSAYTFFKYSICTGAYYFDFWADSTDIINANFAVGCNDTLGTDLGRIAYLNVITDFNPQPGNSVLITRNLYNGATLLGQIQINTTLDTHRYHVEFYLNSSDNSYLWRLQTSGVGKFDLWSSDAYQCGSDMVDNISGVYIQYPAYRHPDSLKTIVTGWQCSDKVITVGNYSNRARYLDYDSNYVILTQAPYYEVIGKIASTSSFGPTRDNRLKPDITATGNTTMCTGQAQDIALKIAGVNRYKVALGGKHERNGGTSMSSPLVAGIVALYLEKRPTATYNEIKNCLIWSAVKDSFTGNNPNPAYGNGKVNAFRALICAGIVYGAMDTACLNYNAVANVDTNGCVPKVYGCTDSTATNYDSLANVNDGSCQFGTRIHNLGLENITVSVIPNPFTNQTTFRIDGLSFEKGEIKIYNQLGQLVDEIKLATRRYQYIYRNDKLTKGVYQYILNADGKNVKAGKLVVE